MTDKQTHSTKGLFVRLSRVTEERLAPIAVRKPRVSRQLLTALVAEEILPMLFFSDAGPRRGPRREQLPDP